MGTTANSGERRLRETGFLAVLAASALFAAAPARADEAASGADAKKDAADAKEGGAKEGDGIGEDPLKRHYFLGVRFRDIVLPQFMMEAFTSGGANGNAWLVILPWTSLPQVSFRVKPIKQLQVREDLGFSISGFFFGLSAGYGF